MAARVPEPRDRAYSPQKCKGLAFTRGDILSVWRPSSRQVSLRRNGNGETGNSAPLPRRLFDPGKFQIAWHSAFPPRLCLITGTLKSGPRLAPVVRALRSPGEIPRAEQAFERPRGIVGNVGGKAKQPAGPQHTGQHRNSPILHEPALPMPPLRPWIGVKQVHLGD